jgi:hypothetical protein
MAAARGQRRAKWAGQSIDAAQYWRWGSANQRKDVQEAAKDSAGSVRIARVGPEKGSVGVDAGRLFSAAGQLVHHAGSRKEEKLKQKEGQSKQAPTV